MLKSFTSFIDQIKHNYQVLRNLVDAYDLNIEEPLIPQLEQKLERELTIDEAQTIQFAEKANRISGHGLSNKRKNRPVSWRGKKKKKKKNG